MPVSLASGFGVAWSVGILGYSTPYVLFALRIVGAWLVSIVGFPHPGVRRRTCIDSGALSPETLHLGRLARVRLRLRVD